MKSLLVRANANLVTTCCSAALLLFGPVAGCSSGGTGTGSGGSASDLAQAPEASTPAPSAPADAPADPAEPTPPATDPSSPPADTPATPPEVVPVGPVCDATAHAGLASFYSGEVPGHACGFGVYDANAMVVAVSPADFGIAAACGACMEATSTQGNVRVQVIDVCSGCATGDLDLCVSAFAQVGVAAMGTAEVTWRYVPCQTSGPIRYYFAPASNAWWFGAQVRNSANAIATFEVLLPDQTFLALTRTSYNYFVAETGLGEGPFTFRVRDVYGQELIDTGVMMAPDVEVPGAEAFPACRAP